MSEIVKKVKLILKRNLDFCCASDRIPNFWNSIYELYQNGILKFQSGKSDYNTIVSDDETISAYEHKISISKMLTSKKPSYSIRDVIISENKCKILCRYIDPHVRFNYIRNEIVISFSIELDNAEDLLAMFKDHIDYDFHKIAVSLFEEREEERVKKEIENIKKDLLCI